MQFLLTARDAVGACERRLAVRSNHIERLRASYLEGVFMMGGALLDDQGEMVGSVAFLNLPTEADAVAWVLADPYSVTGVWETTLLQPTRVLHVREA